MKNQHQPENHLFVDTDGMRLQRFLARAGVASRRHSEAYITAGRVSINDKIVTTLGTRVFPGDSVRVDGELISLKHDTKVLMFHKPVQVLSSMSDDRGRKTLSDFLDEAYTSFFHVGRLDMDTTGLLLLTNDGELGNALVHPRFHVWKTYRVLVDGSLTEADVAALQSGIELEDGKTAPARVSDIKRDSKMQGERTYFSLSIREGKNRQIRRMCDAIGHPVLHLHRYAFGSLDLGGLAEGAYRELTSDEVAQLRLDAGMDA